MLGAISDPVEVKKIRFWAPSEQHLEIQIFKVNSDVWIQNNSKTLIKVGTKSRLFYLSVCNTWSSSAEGWVIWSPLDTISKGHVRKCCHHILHWSLIFPVIEANEKLMWIVLQPISSACPLQALIQIQNLSLGLSSPVHFMHRFLLRHICYLRDTHSSSGLQLWGVENFLLATRKEKGPYKEFISFFSWVNYPGKGFFHCKEHRRADSIHSSNAKRL